MFSKLIHRLNRFAIVLFAVGLVFWLEAFFTVEWSSPYCTSQEDGPTFAAFGLPFPYMRFTGVSSLEYLFMPQVYLLNIILLSAISFPCIRWAFARFSLAIQSRHLFLIGTVGLLLLLSRVMVIGFLLTAGLLRPTPSIGSGHEPYTDFRPVGFSLQDGHYQCKPSRFWFPDGWKHD